MKWVCRETPGSAENGSVSASEELTEVPSSLSIFSYGHYLQSRLDMGEEPSIQKQLLAIQSGPDRRFLAVKC